MKMNLLHLAISCVVAATFAASFTEAADQPNFIVIYADDLGYGDLGCYGAKGYETPVLDRMAEEGMKFTDFSTSSSICTPSRAGLLTGRFAQRWGHDGKVYFPFHDNGMPTEEITIAELLKEAGYQTGIVGKWHLGHKPKYLPLNQGFDFYFGIPYSNDMWQDPKAELAPNVEFKNGRTRDDFLNYDVKSWKYRNDVPLMVGNQVIEWPVDQSQITRRYTQQAQEFIVANKEQSFFLYLAHSMPHTPLFASEDFKDKTERGLFGDVIEELDWSVGEILETLRDNGLEKNTLVIFTSDNGPWLQKKKMAGSAGPLKDGKFSSYEGGCRVPCIAWQPGTVPAGQICESQISTLDFLPTFAALAGAEVPTDRVLDGFDIRAVLAGDCDAAPMREYFLYRGQGIRIGNWKYVMKEDKQQLFDLSSDVGEKENRVKEYPDKAKELATRLQEVTRELGGQIK